MVDDPRTHITPDAFGVAPDLLGLALASPTRRLAAILIDLALAALIARLGIEYLLAAAAALVAWRAIGGPADRLLAGRGRVVFRAASAVLALLIVVNVWNGAVARIRQLEQPNAGNRAEAAGAEEASPAEDERDVEVALKDMGLSAREQANFLLRFASLQMADSQAAGTRGAELGRWVREKTSPGDQRAQFGAALAEAMPPGARAAFMRELASGPGGPPGPDSARAPGQAASGAAPGDSLGGAAGDSARRGRTADSARAGAAGDSAGAGAGGDSARVAPADSVRLLAAANQQLRDRNRQLRDDLGEARAKREGGLRSWLSGISNDLGLGFGWFALYFTAFMVLGRGQTPGKRMLGIKVLRCDNRPIGWWLAFERFGAYTASFSTGLLGFAQILWDRNRQGLHDKAADTVVVRLRNGQPFRIA